MNCYLHADVPAVAFCRSCGRALCGSCQRLVNGTIYCEEHFPVSYAPNPNPYVQPPAAQPVPPAGTSPGLAFALGFIPGVGAIYNGQYLKGLVHAVIFGLLISLMNSVDGRGGAPLLGIILAAFVFYMPFEAFHTAKRRLLGQPVEEFSSLMAQNRFASRTPLGPIFLILIGVLFLLDTLDLLQFRDVARFWPVLLIAAGAFMLYNRISGGGVVENRRPPASGFVDPATGEYGEPRP